MPSANFIVTRTENVNQATNGTGLIRNRAFPQVLHFGSRYKGSESFRVGQGLIIISLASL
jgi:hypothetical protein